MKPEDVPADLLDLAKQGWDRCAATAGPGTYTHEGIRRHILTAVLPEHERQVRERIAAEMPETCPSCFHLTSFHHGEGCWFIVAVGQPGRDLVCPCSLPGLREVGA